MPNNSASLLKDAPRFSKADLFVDAYFAHKFNGTKAALEVFDIRSKNPHVVAASIAYEYLRKPHIVQMIRERTEGVGLTHAWLIEGYKSIAEGQNSALGIAAIDRLAHIMGIEVKPSRYAHKQSVEGGSVVVNMVAPDSLNE